MVVDFELGKERAFRVATIVRIGSWKEDILRSEFKELTDWAKKNRVRTGKWIFYERSSQRWDACLEIRGKAPKPEGRIRLRTLPASAVARVRFNPEEVSPRVVYHGLNDWTKWRKKDHKIRSVTAVREVYETDPWTSSKAWHSCEVQFLVRR